MTFGFLVGSMNFGKVFWVPEKFLFCMGRLVTTELPNLARFTSSTENSATRWNQVTKMFRSRHDCASMSSARSPCNFRPQPDVTISVLREVSEDTVLTRYHSCSRLEKWFLRRTGSVSVFRDITIYQFMPELLQPIWQMMRRFSSYFHTRTLSLLSVAWCSVVVTRFPSMKM